MYVFVNHMCAWFPQRPEEDIGWTAVIDSYESPCGKSELNSDPLQEQMLLTDESSLQPPSQLFLRQLNFYLIFLVLEKWRQENTFVRQDAHCSPLTPLSLSYSQTCLVWAHYCKMSLTNFTVVFWLPHVCWDMCAHTHTHTIINILNSVKICCWCVLVGVCICSRDSNGEDWRAL